MTEHERFALAELLQNRRHELGLSIREIGRRAGVDASTVNLLERGKIVQPQANTLQVLAGVLAIPLADVYAAINWLPEGALPSLRPYMRAKYDSLPDEAVSVVELFIEQLTKHHQQGPHAGEDE